MEQRQQGCVFGGEAGRAGPREAMPLHQAVDFGGPAPTAGGFRWSGRAPVDVSGLHRQIAGVLAAGRISGQAGA